MLPIQCACVAVPMHGPCGRRNRPERCLGERRPRNGCMRAKPPRRLITAVHYRYRCGAYGRSRRGRSDRNAPHRYCLCTAVINRRPQLTRQCSRPTGSRFMRDRHRTAHPSVALAAPDRCGNHPAHVWPLRQFPARRSNGPDLWHGESRCRTWHRPGTSRRRRTLRSFAAITTPAPGTLTC